VHQLPYLLTDACVHNNLDACRIRTTLRLTRQTRARTLKRDGANFPSLASVLGAHQQNLIVYSSWLKVRLDDKQRDTTYTRQIPTRYVRTTRREATVNDRDTESADRISSPHPISAFANLEHWLISHFAQMGAHKYLEELQKKKQSDVMRFLLRVRCWEVRHTDT
jgi:hypothetical protein